MKFSFANRQEGFDSHISASIRGYSDLLDDILLYSQYFVEDNTTVVDIGCSTGKLLRDMVTQNNFASTTKYIGIEIENDFFKYLNEDTSKNLSFFKGNVIDFEFKNCSLITSIFTLQFIAYPLRKKILQQIYDGLNYGGAFIFSEKTVANDPRIQEIRTFTYYDFKRKSFTTEDIMNKERELRHMLKPCTRSDLVSLCTEAGFDRNSIDSFWQNHGFTGFIAIK